jgi:hypothetical protein
VGEISHFARLAPAYEVFKARDKLVLNIHEEGHVFHGEKFWPPLRQTIGP